MKQIKRIAAKPMFVGGAICFTFVPMMQLADHMKADMLEHRTAAFAVAASTSASSSFILALVPDMILGGHYDPIPVVPGGVTYIPGPKVPGASST